MDIIDIQHLKKIRQGLGLSQVELSEQAQVSQSLIAKIESGRLDPSFSNAQKISVALKAHTPKEIQVSKVMSKNIITFTAKTPAIEAVKVMRKKNISQVPVIEEKVVIGLVTENSLLNNLEKLATSQVKEVMIAPPPQVDKSTPISAAIELLRTFSSVLVLEKGELVGIVTKADVMGSAVKEK